MSKLLDVIELADVMFPVDRQHFPAQRCVLAVLRHYFHSLFELGTAAGVHEGDGRAAGEDTVMKEASAGVFLALLRLLHTHKLPKEEHCWEGLQVGEMAPTRGGTVPVVVLYKHSVQLFLEGMTVGNMVARLVWHTIEGCLH